VPRTSYYFGLTDVVVPTHNASAVVRTRLRRGAITLPNATCRGGAVALVGRFAIGVVIGSFRGSKTDNNYDLGESTEHTRATCLGRPTSTVLCKTSGRQPGTRSARSSSLTDPGTWCFSDAHVPRFCVATNYAVAFVRRIITHRLLLHCFATATVVWYNDRNSCVVHCSATALACGSRTALLG
jgi:hypothetical protein